MAKKSFSLYISKYCNKVSPELFFWASPTLSIFIHRRNTVPYWLLWRKSAAFKPHQVQQVTSTMGKKQHKISGVMLLWLKMYFLAYLSFEVINRLKGDKFSASDHLSIPLKALQWNRSWLSFLAVWKNKSTSNILTTSPLKHRNYRINIFAFHNSRKPLLTMCKSRWIQCKSKAGISGKRMSSRGYKYCSAPVRVKFPRHTDTIVRNFVA